MSRGKSVEELGSGLGLLIPHAVLFLNSKEELVFIERKLCAQHSVLFNASLRKH